MNKKDQLQELKQEIAQENLPLRDQATQLVFGVGNPDTELLFIGEAPGFYEDQKGEPFVGNAGKLLDKMLENIKLNRSDVFITNVVMYRPPQNRDPLDTELKAFEPYINKLIEIIDPKVIVTLGRFSMAKFLPNVKITQVHGKLYKKKFLDKEIFVIPMFHPSAALRGETVRAQFENDFSRLPKAIEKVKSLI